MKEKIDTPIEKQEIRRGNELLDNQGNGNLLESLRIFETPDGVKVYAATDRGVGKKENHDRVIINAEASQFTVLDGMGNAVASQILAEKILAYPGNLKKALEEARPEMKHPIVQSGTCLISAKLSPDKNIKVNQVGDSGMLVFGADGKIKFSANHRVRLRSHKLEVDMKMMGIERTSQKLIDTSPADFISGHSGNLYEYDDVQLENGDMVLMFSDVVWCNFSLEEMEKLVQENPNPENLFKIISEQLRKKMLSEGSILKDEEDEFESLEEKARQFFDCDYVPQRDNQSLVVFKL